MNSSAVDARLVIATEKLLDDGCVIWSEKVNVLFYVRINVPDDKDGVNYDAYGATYAEAFNEAYNQLPERTAEVAA